MTTKKETWDEAALRLAVKEAREGFPHESCPDEWRDCNAARIIAEAYLAEHPADEDEAVDEAWLLENGFHKSHQYEGAMRHGGIGFLYLSPPRKDGWREALLEDGMRFNNAAPVQTRGQVLALCRALGIPITPSNQEESRK